MREIQPTHGAGGAAYSATPKPRKRGDKMARAVRDHRDGIVQRFGREDLPFMGPVFPWTPEIEEEIWDGIMSGIATQVLLGPDRDAHLPTERTFYRRLARDKSFQAEYLMAKQASAHRSVDEILAIADAATITDYNVARVQIDARKWYSSKTAPQYYGDRASVEVSGPGGGPIATIDPTRMSASALREMLAATKGDDDQAEQS